MTFNALIAHYGLVAVFVGAGIEGEAMVVTGGAFARHGSFALPLAIAAATLGSFTVDQMLFALGRHHRDSKFVMRFRQKPVFARAIAAIERHPRGFILAFRWIYGLRNVGPVAVGTTAIPARRFVVLNAIAAVVWATTFSTIGYVFGHALERTLARLLDRPLWLGIGAALIGLVLLTVLIVRRRRRQAGGA